MLKVFITLEAHDDMNKYPIPLVTQILAQVYAEGVAAGTMKHGTRHSNAFEVDARRILRICRSALDSADRP